MSDNNKFRHCDSGEHVLSQFVLFTNRAGTISEICDLRADALARINELALGEHIVVAQRRAVVAQSRRR